MIWHKYNDKFLVRHTILNKVVARKQLKISISRIGLPSEINKAYSGCNRNLLFSFIRIKRSLKLAVWTSNSIWSKLVDILGALLNLPVKWAVF